MKTVLVTGASGYLAHRLVPKLAREVDVVGTAANSRHVVAPAHFEHLDVTDKSAVDTLIESLRPDAIIHAAACNPGSDDAAMETVNHIGTANIARAAARVASRLVSVSTDIVHDGCSAPYSDDASPTPVNPYGSSKARGETAVARYYPDAISVRTSLIYGLDLMDRGTEGFRERIDTGQPLKLFTDVIRQPVWVDSLAQALAALALKDTEQSGLINIAGDTAMSRSEFALKMMNYWRINRPDNLEEVSAASLKGVPLDLRLSLERAKTLNYELPGVDVVLQQRQHVVS